LRLDESAYENGCLYHFSNCADGHRNRMKRLSYRSILWVALLLPFLPNQVLAQCSGERWPVKIGTDSDAHSVNLNNLTQTSIANLISINAPAKLQDNKRDSNEKKVYVVSAILKKFAGMYDLDYHMVIADAEGRTMIAEIPSPNCVPAGSYFAAGIARARAQFDAAFTATETFQTVEVPVHITGIGFFDYKEGQAGQAQNGIELHPILDITFDSSFALSAAPQSLTVGQGASNSSTVTSTLSGPFNSTVSLSVAGLPSGATANFGPSSIDAPGSGSSVLTVSTSTTTPVGTYNLVVTGTGGGQTHSVPISLTVTNGNGSTQQLIGNPGFENGSSNPAPWVVTSGVIDGTTSRAPRTGSWKAWLDGYGSAHTDTLQQTVSIPSNATSADLSFWLHIDTAETTTAAADDTMKLQIRNSAGTVLNTLATYSNVNSNTGYTQVSFNLASYKGQTIQIFLVGTEDSSLQTSFIVDDFALNVVTGSTPADFSLTANPSALTVASGTSGTSSVSTTLTGSFNSAVALSASGMPTGVTAAFNPPSIAAPGAGSSTMTVSVGAAVAAGTYNFSVTGSGGGKTHSITVPLTVTVSGGGTTRQVLGNVGFENGSSNPAPWTATSSVIDSNSTSEPAHSGTWKAWLDGYGLAHTDTLYQQVTIASTATQAQLTFWLHIDTAETTTATAYDKLTVQVRNSSGVVLATLATYSNLNKGTGYTQVNFDLSSYKGQTIQIYLVGVEDASLKTSFVVDDFALNVTTP
jgi:hypothetical protein